MALAVKNRLANAGDIRDQASIPGSGRLPGERHATHSSILAGESHGQRNLTGYSPQGCKELDMTEMTWHAHLGQWNRIKSSEVNPLAYDQIIFNKVSKTTQWGRTISSTNDVKNLYLHAKKRKVDIYFTPYNSKSNLKWVKYLILRSETIKSLEQNIDEKFHNTGSCSDFLEPKV